MNKIMVVDDDPNIRELVRLILKKEGFAVLEACDGRDALGKMEESRIDLIVLDVMMPSMDGYAFCREVRGYSNLPILMLTARGETADKVKGFELGSDDYLTKPFEPAELAARLRALARRASGRAAPTIELPGVSIDPATREVRVEGSPVALSGREYALLEALSARPGAILSRAQLEERLYGWKDAVESNAVEVHLSSLRRKLPEGFIRNVRGLGWMIAPRKASA